MPRYKLTATLTDSNINAVRAKLADVFKGTEGGFSVTKIDDSPSRTDRRGDAEALLNEAMSVVEELRDEMQNWHDNIPDNLKESEKAEQVSDVAGELETAADDIQNVIDAVGGIEFPQAIG